MATVPHIRYHDHDYNDDHDHHPDNQNDHHGDHQCGDHHHDHAPGGVLVERQSGARAQKGVTTIMIVGRPR